MDALTLRVNLDCLRKDSQAIINAKVGEANGRKVVFTLYEGRTAFFVPAEATVIFRAQKPDGTILYNNCVIDDGKVEYTITSQTVAVAGVYACELQIVSDGRIIYSPYVTLNVMDNLYADTEVESSNEFTELENALNKIPSLEVINSKYTKPDGGIPKTDLANDVQASLNKADTALQEHQSLAAYRTASEQDLIDSTKQDKLTAGENITITENGTISSTGGGAKAFFLNVFVITETQVVTNKTYAEIKAAIDAGDIIYITDKNDVVYMPQVAETGSKIEFLWLDSHENRTYRWSAVVNSENAWSVTFPEFATTDELGNLAALKTQADDNLVAAINEVKQTSDAKQDKLIAGENITIAADGKTISATGGGGSTIGLDTTLSEAGKAADAKAVGDALAGKQGTISDLETIRSGAAKGATALQTVPSTYRTASAQDTIDSGKVDKVTGKGLSTNDYTAAAKAKVDAIPANPKYTDTLYDDTAVKSRLSAVESKFNGNGSASFASIETASLKTTGEVEIFGAQPHIDFHHANNTDDYTSRIIENAAGVIDILAPNGLKFNGSNLKYNDTAVKNRLTAIENKDDVPLTVKTDSITSGGSTTDVDRITNVSYTAKYIHLLGAVLVRIYCTINTDMNAGYDYDIMTIDGYLPNSTAALSVKCAKNAMAIAKRGDGAGAIQIRPLESGINGYDVWITGFWFV